MSDVYVSPDGQTEQTASTPADRVRLRHAGWTPKPKRTAAPKAAETAAPEEPRKSRKAAE